jgi:hypothetical protein
VIVEKDLLTAMLAARAEFAADGDVHTVQGDARVELLLSTHAGHLPLTRVKQVHLGAAFLSVSTADADYLLPYDRVAGLKIDTQAKTEARTGFRR